MLKEDTIKLLEECNSGSKMAVSAFDEVMDKIKTEELKGLLKDSMVFHKKVEDRISELLLEHKQEPKDPGVMAEAMSWCSINVKHLINSTDAEIAKIIMDGCNMGIESVSRYTNQYKEADPKAKQIAADIIREEEDLAKNLRKYL